MKKDGFSLVELMIVMAVVGIILGTVTMNFIDFSRKHGMESQVKMIYADLMNLRAHSLCERKHHTARITSTRFSLFSSTVTEVKPVTTRTLAYPMTSARQKLHFDEHGVAEGSNTSICIDTDGNPAGVDSLVISFTRIQMGKRKTGKNCESDSILTR